MRGTIGDRRCGSVDDVRGSSDGGTRVTMYDKMIAREDHHSSSDIDDDGP